MLNIKILVYVLSLLMLVMVVEMVRRGKLTFKYASGWIAVLVLAMFLAAFERLLFGISAWLGFELTSNFIFFTLLSVFVFLCLLMTIFLCQQDVRNRLMAQKLALLELELKELRKKSSGES